MVLWQPRYVYAETEHLCYQKVSASDKPIGKAKKIPFSSISKIDELEYGEYCIQCSKRDYTFKAVDSNQCTVMVHNLRQLLGRYRENNDLPNAPSSRAGQSQLSVDAPRHSAKA